MADETQQGSGIFEGDPSFAAAAEDLRFNEADAIIERWASPGGKFNDKTVETLFRIAQKHGVTPEEEAAYQLLGVLESRMLTHWEMQLARESPLEKTTD